MTSTAYHILQKIGMNYSEREYGNVSWGKVFRKFFITLRNAFMLSLMNTPLLAPVAPRLVRPRILRFIGCKIGKHVFIGQRVSIDASYPSKIIMEDYVHVAAHSILLCHQRDLSGYFKGDDYARLGYKVQQIHLKKGCLIGTNTLIMPGVTVGEGAIVGAGSLITRDIPAWTVAAGRPAKVIREIPALPGKINHTDKRSK